MTEIQQKRLDFLNDMIDYYSENPVERRCTNEERGCFYSPETINLPNSEGCAIGRKLPRDLANTIDKNGEYDITSVFDDPGYFPLIPEELKCLGVDFLLLVQGLHDNNNNWSDKGLSKLGNDKVEYIKREYILNE